MFIRESTTSEVSYVISHLHDYDVSANLKPNGVNYSVVHKGDIVGLLQITAFDGFKTLDTYILKRHRGVWLTKKVLKQLYQEIFTDNDVLVIQTANPKSGVLASKAGFIPYGFDGEHSLFVLYKNKLNKEWKLNGQ